MHLVFDSSTNSNLKILSRQSYGNGNLFYDGTQNVCLFLAMCIKFSRITIWIPKIFSIAPIIVLYI